MSWNLRRRLLSGNKDIENRRIVRVTCVLFISGILLTGADAVRSVKQLQPAIERNDYGKGSKTEVLDVKVGDTKKKIRTDIEDDAVEGRIYIELVPNENFVRGLDFYQYMIVNVSGVGLSSQPTLWRTNSLDTYGGTYSSVKAEKFIELNGILEEDWKAPNKAILYAYAKKTYEWFENNPTYDNGELVVFKGTIEY